MNRFERILYEKQLKQRQKGYSDYRIWSHILQKFIVYKNPHLVAVDKLTQVDTSKVFISAAFLDPGRQDYLINFKNQFFFHRTIADFRREDIAIPKRDFEDSSLVLRNPNVFKMWSQDTEKQLDMCYSADVEYWKLAKFVKDQGEQTGIRRTISDNYLHLKEIYKMLSARSNFPCLSAQDFLFFMEHVELVDKKTCTAGIIGMHFIAARTDVENRNLKVHGQNPNDINRFEFLETLIRVAKAKYFENKKATSTDEAVRMLVSKIVEKTYSNMDRFRPEELWTREVNLVFDANISKIMLLYKKYCSPKTGNKMSLEAAKSLMCKDCPAIQMLEKDALYCFAMSQWTCIDIVKDGKMKYYTIEFLEFLELIGRVGHQWFLQSEEGDQMELKDKVCFVMDEWLALIGAVREEAQPYEDGAQGEEETEGHPEPNIVRQHVRKIDDAIDLL